MARRLSSRKSICLLCVLSRLSFTVQSCLSSRLYRAATAFGLNALLPFYHQYHSPICPPLAQFSRPDVSGLRFLTTLPSHVASQRQMSINLSTVSTRHHVSPLILTFTLQVVSRPCSCRKTPRSRAAVRSAQHRAEARPSLPRFPCFGDLCLTRCPSSAGCCACSADRLPVFA
jgi:hypothetical protein